ncbi:uncharacterized protein LOC119612046 [Lucilia sericata]|uniref:uncharacterized protein LOC119612046 n=1 Tax=Lucilia sericata TaxID=13632 RepID=UPI0018A84AFD|nr:uncharacterized protein LOC119612046 [Lucilia sericata]
MKFIKLLTLFTLIIIATITPTSTDITCISCLVKVDKDCFNTENFKVRDYYRKNCPSGYCTNLIGQHGDIDRGYEADYNTRRACGGIDSCNRPQAICCTCNTSDCNSDLFCGTASQIELDYWNIFALIILITVINMS